MSRQNPIPMPMSRCTASIIASRAPLGTMASLFSQGFEEQPVLAARGPVLPAAPTGSRVRRVFARLVAAAREQVPCEDVALPESAMRYVVVRRRIAT